MSKRCLFIITLLSLRVGYSQQRLFPNTPEFQRVRVHIVYLVVGEFAPCVDVVHPTADPHFVGPYVDGPMESVYDGRGVLGALQIGVLQVGVLQSGVLQIGAPQVGAPQVGALQVGVPQVGALQVGALQVGALQVGVPQVGALQVGVPQIGGPQIGALI